MSHTILAPVLRGDELDKALISHPGTAECIKVAGVASFPQMHCRNRPDGRPEGMPGHDEGVIGVCLECGPDGFVNVV